MPAVQVFGTQHRPFGAHSSLAPEQLLPQSMVEPHPSLRMPHHPGWQVARTHVSQRCVTELHSSLPGHPPQLKVWPRPQPSVSRPHAPGEQPVRGTQATQWPAAIVLVLPASVSHRRPDAHEPQYTVPQVGSTYDPHSNCEATHPGAGSDAHAPQSSVEPHWSDTMPHGLLPSSRHVRFGVQGVH